MNLGVAYLLLALAATLEAGGDAFVRAVRPDAPKLVGGAFVVAGGIIMTVWRV